MIAPWTALAPIEVRAAELLLRESQPGDVAVLVGLFDTEQMDRRTPLASPFDAQAVARYVAVAGRARRKVGALQLASTRDGGPYSAEARPARGALPERTATRSPAHTPNAAWLRAKLF